MSKFFIYRPIFAWVVAIFIALFGAIGMTQLPVSMFPSIAPPTVRVSAIYPGASAQQVNDSVISLIVDKLNSVEGVDNIKADSDANGMGNVTVTFKPGVDENFAQVEVQNALAAVESRLPQIVRDLGVMVRRSRSNFLMMVSFVNHNPKVSSLEVVDALTRNVVPELSRIPGVGNVMFFGSEKSARVWLDPVRMESLKVSPAELAQSLKAQSLNIPAGTIGAAPVDPNKKISTAIPLVIKGELNTNEGFGNVVIKGLPDGTQVRLRDVATIESGTEQYMFRSMLNGDFSQVVGIQQSNKGNAVETSKAVREKLDELKRFLPEGTEVSVPVDTADYVSLSINQVRKTLFEAIFLVFIVILLFLQNIRYTFIPIVVVPLALLGAIGFMWPMGMSVNMLTMFAMVLVIGIVVDDAIVVVENVERIMRQRKLPPKEATVIAMQQIQGAVVGITLVLCAVFIPLALVSGSVGNIYRQFALVMSIAIVFSGFFALTLTPALCGSMLKQVDESDLDLHSDKLDASKTRLTIWQRIALGFNKSFNKLRDWYVKAAGWLMRWFWWALAGYAVVVALAAGLFKILPTGFLPAEDQGYVITAISLPPGATQERTKLVADKVTEYVRGNPDVRDISIVLGFSFFGTGPNQAIGFVGLKDWKERQGQGHDAESLKDLFNKDLSQIKDANIMTLTLPSIPELATRSGFEFYLQDRTAQGHDKLIAVRDQLIAKGSKDPRLLMLFANGIEDSTQAELVIDRDLMAAQGVMPATLAQYLPSVVGSSQVADFVEQGRVHKVIFQGRASSRMNPADVMEHSVKNIRGEMVPLSSFSRIEYFKGPLQISTYNGYESISFHGVPMIGKSTGEGMAAIDEMMADAPAGFSHAWTGIAKEEISAGSQISWLMGLSTLCVFLVLAALYESWTVPLAIIMSVPLGIFGVLVALFVHMFSGFTNDIYFHVGMITVMGLSAKNAILLVEFARSLEHEGYSTISAMIRAAQLRFRPIVMTSLAFVLGVLPLYLAKGASAASQNEIGASVLFGMLIGTLLTMLLVPTFFLVIRLATHRYRKKTQLPDDRIEDATRPA